MTDSEVDSELNELLLRLTEVLAALHEDLGDREFLMQERRELLARAQGQGICFQSIAQA